MKKKKTIILLLLIVSIFVDAQIYSQLTNVPTLYIETFNGEDITKEKYITASLTLVDGEKTTVYNDIQIRGRGNSTWYTEKKPYKLKFASKTELLGKEYTKAKKWTLLANHGDKTMIRNALTYDLGKIMGFTFCPAAVFVDLFLNGNYRGTYQISDQVEVYKGRVEVNSNTGWLIELSDDEHKDDPYIVTEKGFYINIKNPEDEDLTDDKRDNILNWCNNLENILFSTYYKDESIGYRSMVDEKTLIDWYIATELVSNPDGFSSIYAYKEESDERIKIGPLWDMDISYGNSNECNWEQTLLAFANREERQFEKVAYMLWQDPWFANKVNNRWIQLIDNGLQTFLIDKIDSLRNIIYLTQEKNYNVWPIDGMVFYFESHTYHQTYDEYIDDLKKFINNHITYLTKKFNELASSSTEIKNLLDTHDDYFRSETFYDLTGIQTINPQSKRLYISKERRKKFIMP